MIKLFASRQGATLLVVLSICYGATIALLGALGSSAVVPFTVAGALVLGVLWVVRSLVGRQS